MSGEDINIQVKTATLPLIRTIAACSLAVCGFIYYGTQKIESALNDISNLKRWQMHDQPRIDQLDRDVTILKTKLDIK